MELLTNTIQVCAGPILRSTLDHGAVAVVLLLGKRCIGELAVNDLNHHINPVGSALIAFIAWNEGSPMLGCVPDEGLDLVLGVACASVMVCSQYSRLEITTTPLDVPGHI